MYAYVEKMHGGYVNIQKKPILTMTMLSCDKPGKLLLKL